MIDYHLKEIPESWQVTNLGTICSAILDGTHQTPKYVDKGIPFFSVENVTINNFNDTKYISPEEHEKLIKRCKPEKNDILMTRIGSLGDTRLIDWDVNASIYVSLALLKINKKCVDYKYLYSYTKSTLFIRDVERRSLLNAAPKKINLGDISKVPIVLPPLPEQQKIAEILSTWDEAIDKTEQLIEALRQRKKGLMQNLLNGQVRFPGFETKWTRTKISEMGTVVNGGTPSTFESSFWNGDILWATPTDITKLPSKYINFTENKITDKGLKNSSANLLPQGSLLVCSRATIGAIAINKVPIATNQGFKNLKPNENFDVHFLYHLLSYNKHILIRYANGSTFLELPKKDFEEISFHIPNLSEQRKISEILNLADLEIEKYEILISRLKDQKKGLMQRLLTGQVRVKVDE